MTQITRVMAIKTYFDLNAKQAMTEIGKLSPQDREWFGEECARELGMELSDRVTIPK